MLSASLETIEKYIQKQLPSISKITNLEKARATELLKCTAIINKSNHRSDVLQSIDNLFEGLVTLKVTLYFCEPKIKLIYNVKTEITLVSPNCWLVELDLASHFLFFSNRLVRRWMVFSISLCLCLLLTVFRIILKPLQAGTCVLQKFKASISMEIFHQSLQFCGFLPKRFSYFPASVVGNTWGSNYENILDTLARFLTQKQKNLLN